MEFTTKDKILSAISYLSWLCLIIVWFVNKDEQNELVSHHMSQALVLNVLGTVVGIMIKIKALETVATIISFVVFVLLIWGIVNSARGSLDDIPVLSIGKDK